MRIVFILIGAAVVAAFLWKGFQAWRHEQKELHRQAERGRDAERHDRVEEAVRNRIAQDTAAHDAAVNK